MKPFHGRHLSPLTLAIVLFVYHNGAEAFVHPYQQTMTRSLSLLLPRRAPLENSIPLVARRKHSSLESTTTRLNMSLLPHDLVLALQAPSLDGNSHDWLHVYGTLLQMYPLTTKAITAALLAYMGDAIAQYAAACPTPSPHQATSFSDSESQPSYDLARGLTFLLFGAMYTGAFQHVWFTYLSNHVADWGEAWHVWGPQRAALPVDLMVDSKDWWTYFDVASQLENPPSGAVLAAAKVAVNQFLIVPVVYIPLFFWVTGNFDVSRAIQRAQGGLYGRLLRRNYVYWLPVQFVQFFLLPGEWQIPFVSAASLVWTIILSSIGSASTSTIDTPTATTAQGTVLALPPPSQSTTNVDELSLPLYIQDQSE